MLCNNLISNTDKSASGHALGNLHGTRFQAELSKHGFASPFPLQMAARIGGITCAIRPHALRFYTRFIAANPIKQVAHWPLYIRPHRLHYGNRCPLHSFAAARDHARGFPLNVELSDAVHFHRSSGKGKDGKVVLILGWLGCKHRYLRRLIEWVSIWISVEECCPGNLFW